MMATQKRGRDERPPFIPSEAWITAFEEQMSEPDFEASLRAFARMRARLVSHSGRKVDEYYVDELVQDVLDDTLLGEIAWDPARVDLKKHVRDAIQSRTRHHYAHAIRFAHDAVDIAHEPSLVHVERALADREAEASERQHLARVATALIAALRVVAEDDIELLLLIDAYAHDITQKADVIQRTGLTGLQYDAARKRMRRLLDHLPSHLVHEAR